VSRHTFSVQAAGAGSHKPRAGSKPVIARHPIAQWQARAEEMGGETPDERRRYLIPRDGLITAYMTMAYDLYIVRNNIRSQSPRSITQRALNFK
jgi:hypothetical protein